MGIHEWSYDNEIALDKRYKVPLRDKVRRCKNVKVEVELGFDVEPRGRKRSAASTATCRPCSSTQLCIECDACVDICPMDCITFTEQRRRSRPAHAAERAGART